LNAPTCTNHCRVDERPAVDDLVLAVTAGLAALPLAGAFGVGADSAFIVSAGCVVGAAGAGADASALSVGLSDAFGADDDALAGVDVLDAVAVAASGGAVGGAGAGVVGASALAGGCAGSGGAAGALALSLPGGAFIASRM
jgi:hypothetical protein